MRRELTDGEVEDILQALNVAAKDAEDTAEKSKKMGINRITESIQQQEKTYRRLQKEIGNCKSVTVER